MTIHFNIGEAKAQLSKLIAAALRGEEVVIDKDGVPQVRLTPVSAEQKIDKEERKKRIAAILADIDAMDFDRSGSWELEYDENGLPI